MTIRGSEAGKAPAYPWDSLTCQGGQGGAGGRLLAGYAAVEGMEMETNKGRRGDGEGGGSYCIFS